MGYKPRLHINDLFYFPIIYTSDLDMKFIHFASRTYFICETNRKEKPDVFDSFQSVHCTVNGF